MEFPEDFTMISSLFVNLALMSLSTPPTLKHAVIILLIKTLFFSFFFSSFFLGWDLLKDVEDDRYIKKPSKIKNFPGPLQKEYKNNDIIPQVKEKSYVPHHVNETKKMLIERIF